MENFDENDQELLLEERKKLEEELILLENEIKKKKEKLSEINSKLPFNGRKRGTKAGRKRQEWKVNAFLEQLKRQREAEATGNLDQTTPDTSVKEELSQIQSNVPFTGRKRGTKAGKKRREWKAKAILNQLKRKAAADTGNSNKMGN